MGMERGSARAKGIGAVGYSNRKIKKKATREKNP